MPLKRLGVAFSWRDRFLHDIVRGARFAEEAGLESVWISEAWGREAFSTLAAIANATQRIKLGTGIVNVYSRSPALLAMSAATLNELSSGRAILGLGTSGMGVVERWHGLSYERPLLRLRESITIVRQALSGERINLTGEVFRVSDFRLAMPPPIHKIPIYIAALGPKMMRLAGEIADGVVLYLYPLSKIPAAVSEIRKGAKAADKSTDAIDVAAFLPTQVSERPEARQEVARVIAYYVGGMGTYYHRLIAQSGFRTEADRIRSAWERGDREQATEAVTQELIDSVSLAGNPSDCRKRLEAFREAGVTLPILSFYLRDSNDLQTVYESVRSLAT